MDRKEGRTPKNWCLPTVVLEKTPESSLDSKEITPVNLKGDQTLNIQWKDWSWSSSILVICCEQRTHWGKSLMLGKIEGRRRGRQRMRRLVCIIDAMDMNLSKFREMVRDREVWRAAVQGYTKNQTQLGDWTTTKVALKELTAKSLKERGQLPYLEWIKEEGFWGSDSNAECGWGQLKGRAGQPWGMQERRRPWGGFLRTSQWKGQ